MSEVGTTGRAWAWWIFIIAIIAFIIAFIWSIVLTMTTDDKHKRGKNPNPKDEEDRARMIQGNTFLWFAILALLFIALFLCMCPAFKCFNPCGKQGYGYTSNPGMAY